MKLDQSYLSRVESGAITIPSSSFRGAFLEALGLTQADLDHDDQAPGVAPGPLPLAANLLSVVFDEVTTEVGDFEAVPSIVSGNTFSNQAELQTRLRERLYEAKSDAVVAWDSRNPLPIDAVGVKGLQHAIAHFASRRHLTAILRISGPDDNRLEMYRFGIQILVRFALRDDVQGGGGLTCRYLISTGAHRFPADLAAFKGHSYLMGVPTENLFNVDKGFESNIGCDVIYDHLKFMAGEALEKCSIFTPVQNAEWVSRVAETAGNVGLMQPMLAWCTRPLSDFSKDSQWGKRVVEAVGGRSNEFSLLADARRRGVASFLDSIGRSRFAQVCDANTLSTWADSGIRLDVRSSSEYPDKADDRRRRLRTVIDLLERYHNFELAIVDDFDSLSEWRAKKKDNHTWSWLVAEPGRVVTEVQVPEAAMNRRRGWRKAAALGHDKIGVLIEDSNIAKAVRGLFETSWRAVPARNKDRGEVIGRLKALLGGIRDGT